MPYQRAPLVLLDELVLAVAVCADVVREAGGERRLELAVGRARFGVGAHVVAVGDVARYRMNGVVLVGVQLVRAVRAALPEIAAARQAELAHSLVARGGELARKAVKSGDVAHDGQHVDNRLRLQPRHSGAADVENRYQIVPYDFAHKRRLGLEHLGPFRVVVRDAHQHVIRVVGFHNSAPSSAFIIFFVHHEFFERLRLAAADVLAYLCAAQPFRNRGRRRGFQNR